MTNAAANSQPALHPDLDSLAPLLGTWRGTGAGEYPTIESFAYTEEVTIGHVGKPFLAYSQRTRHQDTGLPLHAETGYFRPVGSDRLELVVAQPSGIAEVLAGAIEREPTPEGDTLVVSLRSTEVVTTETAKEVAEVTRNISVVGDRMTYKVSMAAVGQALQHHLEATLERVD